MKKLLALSITLAVILGLCACEKKSESITLPAILRQFDTSIYENYTIFAGNIERTETVGLLSDILQIKEWEEIDAPRDDETLILKIHLSELYEISLYNSYAWVYYGYASAVDKESAYYSIPKAATENIHSYIDSISS